MKLRIKLCFLYLILISASVLAEQNMLEQKTSLATIGAQGIENLKIVSAGYGTKICKDTVKTKDAIVKIAWPQIRHTCSKFTFGMMEKFSDDPSIIYSLCVFSALKVCQQKIGIKKPCERVETCRATLGVPRKGE